MELSQQISKHFRDVFFGGNWTSVNFKDTLSGISLEEAVTKIDNLNTIAALVFHINYYVENVLKVLRGGPLEGADKYSFEVPPLDSEAAWQSLIRSTLDNAAAFSAEIEQLESTVFFKDFRDAQYGNNYRNITGIIEHTHYHLGQIVIIHKILAGRSQRPQD
ncbi:hypothetical protein GCM10027051_14950 [Niabella terrae]